MSFLHIKQTAECQQQNISLTTTLAAGCCTQHSPLKDRDQHGMTSRWAGASAAFTLVLAGISSAHPHNHKGKGSVQEGTATYRTAESGEACLCQPVGHALSQGRRWAGCRCTPVLHCQAQSEPVQVPGSREKGLMSLKPRA